MLFRSIRAKSMDGLNTYSNWCWVQVLAPPPTPAPTAKPTASPTKKPVTASPSPTATTSPGAPTAAPTNPVLAHPLAAPASEPGVVPEDGKIYFIRNAYQGFFLDAGKSNLTLTRYTGLPEQKFLVTITNGVYSFTPLIDENKRINVNGGDTTGVNLNLASSNGLASQKFTLSSQTVTGANGSCYQIKPQNKTRVVNANVPMSSDAHFHYDSYDDEDYIANGCNGHEIFRGAVALWPTTSGSNQAWQFIEASYTPGIVNGETYYITNRETGLQLNAASNTENVALTATAFDHSTGQKFLVNSLLNGRFIIGRPEGTRFITYVNGNAVIRTLTVVSEQQLMIDRIGKSGLYHIKLFLNGTTYYLRNSGSTIAFSTSVGNASEWSFEKVNKGYYRHFGDTDGFYIAGYTKKTHSIGANQFPQMATLMKDADIVYAGFHGRNSALRKEGNFFAATNYVYMQYNTDIYFSRPSNPSNMGTITYDMVLECNYNAFSKVKMVLYTACLVGLPYQRNDSGQYLCYNLCDETYYRGAHFSMGPDWKLTNSHAKNLSRAFAKELENGKTIAEALVEARKAAAQEEWGGLPGERFGGGGLYAVGDTMQRPTRG